MRCVALATTFLVGCSQLLGIEDPHGRQGGPDGGSGSDGATPGAWMVVMHLGQGRDNAAAAVLDGKIHLIGGQLAGQNFAGQHDVIDPTTHDITAAAPISPTRQFHGTNAAVNAATILVAGDNEPSGCTDDASVYDPQNDVWNATLSIGAPGPAAPACDLDVIAFNGNVFAIGGSPGVGPVLADVLFQDFTGQWNRDTSMPTPRAGAASATFANRLFVAGGTDGAAPGLRVVESFDGNAWRTEPALAHARASFGLAVVGNRMFAIGGDDGGPLASVEVFDGTSWQPGPDLPQPMIGFSTAVVGNTIYVLGGVANGTALDTVLAFTPP